MHQHNASTFEAKCDVIKSLFAPYRPDDVAIALSVSDLWLPNTSSQVKHTFAFAVFASMSPNSFFASKTLDSYDDYKKFIEKLHDLLPNFGMLEDYVPELDWGEIRFLSMGKPFKVFYGGSVERITDFITAFDLVHTQTPAASIDMHVALLAQDHVISGVERKIVGTAEDIQAGHIETPSADFWRASRSVLRAIATHTDFVNLSNGLVTELGKSPMPKDQKSFSSGIYDGSALPAFLINIEGKHFPLMLRNSASTVIEHWAKRRQAASPKAIADFVSQRFEKVIGGPLSLVTRDARHPVNFSAAILGGNKPYLIILQDRNRLAELSNAQAVMQDVMKSGDWALLPEGQRNPVQIYKGSSAPSFDNLRIIAILSDASTEIGLFNLPKTDIRFLPLPDFVTIFDSIESLDELDRYWSFIDSQAGTVNPFSGPVDQFAAFRDSHGLLADGAIVPTMIALDPHWGSTWRYKELGKYWENVPPSLPDLNSQWTPKRDADGLYQLVAKRLPALSWSTVIEKCVAHFVLVANAQDIPLDNGRILELTIHTLADSLSQRQAVLSTHLFPSYRQIVTICRARTDALVSESQNDHVDEPLFSDWRIIGDVNAPMLEIEVSVNLQRVQHRISDAVDASFEVESISAWIEGLSTMLGISPDTTVLDELRSTSARPPRFTLKLAPRDIDVPYFASPRVPDLEHYKIARRDLAFIFKDVAKPGRYELAKAKVLIDQARDKYRKLIHDKISIFDRDYVARFCVEQIDQIITQFDRTQTRTQMSLTHEVSYDRSKHLAEAHDRFVKDAKNYRYLLEARLSIPSVGSEEVSTDAIVKIVAQIDWLLVLYSASDVLHNGIDVAGLDLDDSFIPQVYFSEIDSREEAFASEAADMRLGIGLTPSDKVGAIQPGNTPEWVQLDESFEKDTSLKLSQFVAALTIFTRWPSAIGETELNFIYSAPAAKVRDVMVESVEGLSNVAAEKVIELVTLRPEGIRRLLGKSIDEIDVPLWEHNKRGDRYMLKPIIAGQNGTLVWGAASVGRSESVWLQSLSQGYMPADFNWPNVRRAVDETKDYLEKRLEVVTALILERASPHIAAGIDFARRFPNEGFDDVGDFDGLAYFPDINRWLAVECKYNQPAFCLKDARRLRERIFGRPTKDKGQFEKIERRTAFLKINSERLRTLLGWPAPRADAAIAVDELYVSRDIYWWMRNPPYKVDATFVRVDALEAWLRDNQLLRQGP
jgi:hypothetical protein